jgi:hypothetical protein
VFWWWCWINWRGTTFRSFVDFDKTWKHVGNHEMIWESRRLTIREIAYALNISFGSVQFVLMKNVNIRCVSTKFVPCLLLQKQQELRLFILLELCNHMNSNSYFYKVWSLETNLGYMVMILKQKCRVLTVKHGTRHEEGKHANQNQMWKPCW